MMTTRAKGIAATFMLLSLSGCAALYPRYTTAYSAVPAGLAESGELSPAPDTVHRLSVISAEVPRQTRDGRAWDADGAPDPYVVIFRNGAEVYRTRSIANNYRPEWDPQHDYVDVILRDNDEIRVELRDDDGLGSDPVGIGIARGVPSDARNGGVWMMRLEGGPVVSLRTVPPPPQLGMGLTYEFRDDALYVVAIEEASPARAAGLRPGDRIVAVDGRAVAQLGETGARQALDRNTMQDVTLRVVRGRGSTDEVTVRRGAVYPAR